MYRTKININAVTKKSGYNLLQIACLYSVPVELVEFLLTKFDIKILDSSGYNLLQLACLYSAPVKLVEFLLTKFDIKCLDPNDNASILILALCSKQYSGKEVRFALIKFLINQKIILQDKV